MEPENKRIDIINFMAPINDSTISRLIDLSFTAHSEGSEEIHLFLSSVGGKLYSAMTAYHFLRSLDVTLCAHNVGTIESAALVVFLAADHRTTSPTSRFLFYSFEWTFYRDHIRYPEIIEAYESLKYDTECYAQIFNERTNRSFDINCCLTGPAMVMGPEEAVKAGIVTDPNIAAPKIPELAKFWSVH